MHVREHLVIELSAHPVVTIDAWNTPQRSLTAVAVLDRKEQGGRVNSSVALLLYTPPPSLAELPWAMMLRIGAGCGEPALPALHQ